MISLYESIFNIGDPSAAKKTLNTVRIKDIKKTLFSDFIFGDSMLDFKEPEFENKLSIADDDILTISELRRFKDMSTTILLNQHSKSIFDKNDIAGINFIPSHKGNPESHSNLVLYVPKNIDMKTHMGPFEIINSKCMFTDYEIRTSSYLAGTSTKGFGCIKNLKFSSSTTVDQICVHNHMLDSCDLGQCNSINFITTTENMHPTVLLKNSKLSTSNVYILIKDIYDPKIFQEWKDFLFDGSDLRKDLLKLLGFDGIKFNKFIMSLYYEYESGENIQITSANQIPDGSLYRKLGKYHYRIPGIPGEVYTYIHKR